MHLTYFKYITVYNQLRVKHEFLNNDCYQEYILRSSFKINLTQ